MKGKTLIIVGALLVLLHFGSKAAAAKALRVLFSGARLIKSGGIVPNVEISFDAQNATGAALNVKSISGDLYINNKLVSNVSEFKSQTIAANASSRLTVTLSPSILGIGTLLANMLRTGVKAVARFDGVINAEGAAIPIHQTTTII